MLEDESSLALSAVEDDDPDLGGRQGRDVPVGRVRNLEHVLDGVTTGKGKVKNLWLILHSVLFVESWPVSKRKILATPQDW